jgi:hypothetical protein
MYVFNAMLLYLECFCMLYVFEVDVCDTACMYMAKLR